MKQIVLAILIVVGFAARDVEADEARSPAVEDVISQQIEAFKADDFTRAFGFASPNIKRIFRTPEMFGHMVQHGYPMVWRPANVEFLELREIDGRLWQKVRISDAKGDLHMLDYQMIELPGGWKINGVQLLEMPGMTA
ncbi:DUF4864 domain-containing protein [Marimonas lutisalis]|uniref:DUF4864 domain-containing protein n=1 Tax=Marimonas lutisalis TaxID=2545756 RepID=UPI0010F79AA8|nr:DUF4864 domain-containing protein [Marimonas lutisalis]